MRMVHAATIVSVVVAGTAEPQNQTSDPGKAVELYQALREGTARIELEPKPSVLHEVEDSRYQPGQVWRYRTRPGEERSRLIVCRIESGPDFGTVVHVQVAGVRMRKSSGPRARSTTTDHIPMNRDALNVSVTAVQGTDGTCKNFDAAYAEWRREFLSPSGRAGVFTASVAESIELLDKASNFGSVEPSK